MPSFSRRCSRTTPGRSIGTMNSVKPSCPASASVFVTSTIASARWPLVMYVFEPLMTYSPEPSSARTARVLIAATSEPASGSVIPRQRIFVPAIAGTSHSCFCASVPNARIGGIVMSVCTAMPIASPPERACTSSSASTSEQG